MLLAAAGWKRGAACLSSCSSLPSPGEEPKLMLGGEMQGDGEKRGDLG